jgi:lycopene cyclase domain-containing protein
VSYPSYTLAVVAGAIVVVVIDLAVTRVRLVTRKAFWTAYAIILAFQLIVNGVLTGRPVVRYRPSAIIGIRLAYAPVEDLVFGFALVLLTLTVWVRLGRRARRASSSPRAATATRRGRPTEARPPKTS